MPANDRERFYDLASRWMQLRMRFLRWIGQQPGEEAMAARLKRNRTWRQRRRAHKPQPPDKG
jgi:hypothetical protein